MTQAEALQQIAEYRSGARKPFREGINLALYLDALEMIVKRPRMFNMGTFESETRCGTVCCFAGTVNVLTCRDNDWNAVVAARTSLRLDPLEPARLFYTSGWPSAWWRRLHFPKTPQYALVAAERFLYFLERGQ